MKKNLLKVLIVSIASIAIISILIINIIYYSNMTHWEIPQIQYYGFKRNAISFIIMIIIVVLVYYLNKIKMKKHIKRVVLIAILVIYFATQIIWIINTPAKQFADSLEVLRISERMTNNKELTEYQTNYLQYYPQQLTMAIFFNNIFCLTRSSNYITLEVLNVISNILSVIGLYLILLKFEKKYKVNKVLFFVMTLSFVPIVLLSSFIYGDFIGMACSIWSVYFYYRYIEEKRYRLVFYVGILMFLACCVRMNYFIFVIAMIIHLFQIQLEQSNDKLKKWGKYICICSIIIAIIIIPSTIIKRIYAKKYNIQLNKGFSTIPYLYMGMSEGERANGWYNDEVGEIVFDLMNSNGDTTEIIDSCKKETSERFTFLLNHPVYTYRFYRDKMITIWADPTMEYKFYNTYEIESDNIEQQSLVKEILFGEVYEYIVIYQKALLMLILIGSIMTILIKRKNLDFEIVLLYLIFIGGVSFHILWEAKSRYIIPYVVIIMPCACIGISSFMEILEKKIRKASSE